MVDFLNTLSQYRVYYYLVITIISFSFFLRFAPSTLKYRDKGSFILSLQSGSLLVFTSGFSISAFISQFYPQYFDPYGIWFATVISLFVIFFQFLTLLSFNSPKTKEILKIIDVSDQSITQKLEEEVRNSQRYERMVQDYADFAYAASHDLRTPATTIKGMVDILEDELDTNCSWNNDLREVFGYLKSASENLLELIRSISEYSQIELDPQRVTDFTINELIDRSVEMLDIGDLEIVKTCNGFKLRADKILLQRVLQNLIENSIKFGAHKVVFSCSKKKDEAVLSIEDDGIGFDPEYSKKIFQIFERLNPDKQGRGIGLTLCQKIVHKHGGTIWAESKGANLGAKITFTIPDSIS